MRMILSPAGIAGSFAITSISKLLIVVSILATSVACNSSTPACKADLKDVDGDGYFTCSEGAIEDQDCDDASPDIHPDAVEVCDDIDNNCDGEVDEGVSALWYPDADQDLYGDASSTALRACTQPEGRVDDNTDCNDSDASINVLAIEVCDASDNNCDGAIDEGVTLTWYRDSDGDNSGTRIDTIQACTQPSGYAADAADCNDDNAAIHPGATETCNNQDEDCDGYLDEGAGSIWYKDADGDGYGNEDSTTFACVPPTAYVGDATDCNDSDVSIHPGSTEVCNTLDDDCDGSADDGLPTRTYYQDLDSDGYGNNSVTVVYCSQPTGYATNTNDCNDADPTIFPFAIETCNGLDDDCDKVRDDGLELGFWVDFDGDGFGGHVCSIPTGYQSALRRGDCDDSNSAVRPGTDSSSTDCCARDKVRCVRLGGFSKSTIAAAMTSLGTVDGATIWIGPDSTSSGYEPIVTPTITLSSSPHLTLMSSDGRAKTTLTPDSTSSRLLLSSASGVVLDGLTLQGRSTAVTANGGILAVTGGDITLRDCTVVGGIVQTGTSTDAGYGGGIYVKSGSITLDGVILYDNSAQQDGGAIFAGAGTELTINGGWIHHNVAGSYGGAGNNGGGIHAEGNLILTNVLLEQNLASGQGGGISQFGGTASLTNGVMFRNYSSQPNGGAMKIAGAEVSLSHCAIVQNGAGGTYDCNVSTGGIWIQGGDATLTITNSILSHNYRESELTCSGGVCEPPFYNERDGMNVVGSSCSGSVTPASNVKLLNSDFYRDGVTGDTLPAYGIAGSGWTTATFSASLGSWQKVDPKFYHIDAAELHLTKDSTSLKNAGTPASCTASTCDPDGTRPDLGIYGGPGGAKWDIDLDGTYEWWWYDSYYPMPSGVTGEWDAYDTN